RIFTIHQYMVNTSVRDIPSLHPFWGAWLISIVLTVVGLVATVRASKDKSVFDVERMKLNLKVPLNLIVKRLKR
ncbi:MAG: hypothetical protein ACPGAA_06735, partial [Flavobacteriaceae bacterium]